MAKESGPKPDNATSWRVSRDSIGGMATRTALGVLRRAHPDARDTLFHAADMTYPAVIFQFPNLTVTAVQVRDGTEIDRSPLPLRSDSAATFWIVRGSAGLLRDGIRTNGTWSDIVRKYGNAYVITDAAKFVVSVCQLPGIEMAIPFPTGSHAVIDQQRVDSAASIPKEATITEVTVWPSITTWTTGC